MGAQSFDVRDEVPGGVFFEGGVGCGFAGAALVEEDATVVGRVKISSMMDYSGSIERLGRRMPYLSRSSIPAPGPP